MPGPIDPAVRAAIERALQDGPGESRAALARRFGVSPRTVQRFADALGLSGLWETSGTAAATVAARDHLKARRAVLSARLLDEAERFLDQLRRPHLVFSFGGKDNTYAEHLLEAAPTGDLRNLMTSAAVAIDKHLAVDKHDQGDDGDDTASMLGRLAEGLDAAYRQLTATPATDTGEGPPA